MEYLGLDPRFGELPSVPVASVAPTPAPTLLPTNLTFMPRPIAPLRTPTNRRPQRAPVPLETYFSSSSTPIPEDQPWFISPNRDDFGDPADECFAVLEVRSFTHE